MVFLEGSKVPHYNTIVGVISANIAFVIDFYRTS